MSVLLNPELPPEAVFAAVTFLAGKDHHPFAIRASVSGARTSGFHTEFESEGDHRGPIVALREVRECLESLGDMLVKAETHSGVLQVHQATFEGFSSVL